MALFVMALYQCFADEALLKYIDLTINKCLPR